MRGSHPTSSPAAVVLRASPGSGPTDRWRRSAGDQPQPHQEGVGGRSMQCLAAESEPVFWRRLSPFLFFIFWFVCFVGRLVQKAFFFHGQVLGPSMALYPPMNLPSDGYPCTLLVGALYLLLGTWMTSRVEVALRGSVPSPKPSKLPTCPWTTAGESWHAGPVG